MNMRLQIKQWGNSKAIRLPKELTHSMNLDMGDFLELEQIDDNTLRVVVVPHKKTTKRLTLNERIAIIDIRIDLPSKNGMIYNRQEAKFNGKICNKKRRHHHSLLKPCGWQRVAR